MADQTFAVNCGFFDAINSDRVYSADEMNRPYKRVISNGVFATPNGTPSTDLQVTASSGMNIICKKGEGLFGDKWFENPSGIAITVPSNTGTVPRIDSVLVQVDTRTSGRVGNIVHRTGTPASSPVPPAINQTEGVIEYRLANIRVNAGVSAITQSMITDRRGSSDCPWVTSLIYQVDTSTLYDQWAAAYAEYFEEEKAIWDAWYAQLTEDLDVSMTLDRHTNTVITTATTTGTIPIGLAYNHNTDILEVYINGLRAVEGTHYVVVDDTTILVENQLQIGQEVTFVVMRSVISGSATNIMVLLQELESQITGIAGGTPTVVDAKADMTEHDKIYILSTDGKWYYYSATQEDWVIGGTYGGVPTDTTLSISGSAADAKAVGEALAEKADVDDVTAIEGALDDVNSALSETDERVDKLDGCFDYSPNLFNQNDISVGLLRANTGVLDTSYSAYMTSDFMPVEEGDIVRAQYTVGTTRYDSNVDNKLSFYSAVFYNASKEYISGSNGARTATAPENAKYFRFSLKNDKYESISDLAVIISSSSTVIPYYPQGVYVSLKESKIPVSYDAHIETLSERVVENYDGYEITPKQTTFFHFTKNMINPAERVSGQFVNQNNGVFTDSSGHTRTGYIAVEASTDYVLRTEEGSAGFRYAFYQSDKTYISGALMSSTNDMIITSPSNGAFVAVSLNTGVSPWMLAKYVNGDKSFESYNTVYIEPQYIPSEGEIGADIKLALPDKIYATSGIELNIYFSGLTENWDSYSWKSTCTKGQQLERGFRITPTDADAGTYDLTIGVYSKDGLTLLGEKTVSLIVTAKSAGTGESKSIIVLGDSTTNNGTVIVKLHADFADDPMNITTIGTRGTAPYNMEGRSGWALPDYFNRESTGSGADTIYNAFYNPVTQTFDADYYFTNSGIAKPDWFFINMGINDMMPYKTDATAEANADTCIDYLQAMVESVQDASPNTLIGVCVTIPPNDSQDAFGKAYGSNRISRDRYRRNNLILATKIIDAFDGMENDGIYVIPIHCSLDTKYNMGLESIPVNSRNSKTYDSPIANGGVHPYETGYWQIADVYTAFLKANT